MTFESALSGKNSLDIHLDNEFIFLAQFIRFYKNRVSCEDEPRCVAWLHKLLAPTRDGTIRNVRNTYLAELLLAMQSGQLCGPFAKKPEKGALSLSELQSPPDIGAVGEPAWLDTVINAPIPRGDDADQRTYIATQAHPDGRSAYAYLAVSTTDHDHWVDQLAASDNESIVNVTSPRSYADPTSCDSCASVYPIPEDIKLPCPGDRSLGGRCKAQNANDARSAECSTEDDVIRCPYDTDPLIRFYDEILSLVESTLRTGYCSDDAYIAELLHRMEEQVVRAQPVCDPAQLEMPAGPFKLDLLHQLERKLLARRDQVKRLTRIGLSSTQREFSEDLPEDCSVDLDISLDEELWEAAACRGPSSTNMMLLESVYPPQLVSRYVQVLIRERRALIGRMRAEHQVLVSSLQNDVQKDIEESLDRFREARALWVLLLRATQELQHIKRYEFGNASEADDGVAIRETVREIRDAMIALDEEGRRGTHLADQLVSEQQDLLSAEREAGKHAQRLLAHNEALRMNLQTLEALEAAQLRRIAELQREEE